MTNLVMTWSVADFPLLPSLRSLDLSRLQSLDLESFYDICQLSLTSLSLHGASVSVGVDWSDLRRIRKLERLDLSERLDLAAAYALLAKWLGTLPLLQWLNLKRTELASRNHLADRNLATLFQRGVVVLT